jgi:hypothetical protein
VQRFDTNKHRTGLFSPQNSCVLHTHNTDNPAGVQLAARTSNVSSESAVTGTAPSAQPKFPLFAIYAHFLSYYFNAQYSPGARGVSLLLYTALICFQLFMTSISACDYALCSEGRCNDTSLCNLAQYSFYDKIGKFQFLIRLINFMNDV